MNANFDDELNLQNNSRTVAVSGRITWDVRDGPDAWAEIKDVAVEQRGVVASQVNASTKLYRGDNDWRLDVNSSSRFTPGQARVHARLIVHRTDETTAERSWSSYVQLQ